MKTEMELIPPRINPVPEDIRRPLWSVMIPTFNCAQYLRQTLESILSQDPGPEQMQIEVVDDCSTKDDPEAVVRAVGGSRVNFYRQPRNGGATTNFNTCIERSRGQLVHILHGDDFVLPNFYEVVNRQAANFPDCHGFFVRSFIVSENGDIESLYNRLESLEQPGKNPGPMFYGNQILAPGAVVRRSFYETHGGFRPDLAHVADWEMWIRVISAGAGLSINQPLAAYRYFPGNDTGRLAKTGENLRDYLRLANLLARRFPHFDRGRFVAFVVDMAQAQARRFRDLGDHEAALQNTRLAGELGLTPPLWIRLRRAAGAARRSFAARH